MQPRKSWRYKMGFNPRACGRRDQMLKQKSHCKTVSIHAPAGDATVTEPVEMPERLFQSTRLRETRRRCATDNKALRGFNPRACGRRDL